jgi:hypothetical protein
MLMKTSIEKMYTNENNLLFPYSFEAPEVLNYFHLLNHLKLETETFLIKIL